MSKEEKKAEIDVFYRQPENYTPRYVTGLFGSQTPVGNYLQMAFYTEVHDVPARSFLSQGLDGLWKDEHKPHAIIREIHSGIIIDMDSAKGFIRWLQEKVDQIEKPSVGENKAKKETPD